MMAVTCFLFALALSTASPSVASASASDVVNETGLLRGSAVSEEESMMPSADNTEENEAVQQFWNETLLDDEESEGSSWLSSARALLSPRRLFFGLCHAGYEGQSIAGKCKKCDGGDTRRRRSTECSRCGVSYYDKGDYDDACTKCAYGATRRRRASVSCTSCPEGYFSNINMDDCKRCVGGEVVSNSPGPEGNTCEQCSRGYYDAGDFQQCQIAPEALPGPCAVDSNAGGCINQQSFVPKWVGNGWNAGTLWTIRSSCGGTEKTWVLFGDLDEVSSSFVGADYANTLWRSVGLANGDSVQVGTFYAGVPGSPGYSLDIQPLVAMAGEDKFDLMIQYGDEEVYEKCISGFSQTINADIGDGEYVFVNNAQAKAAVPGTIGEHGMFGTVNDKIDGYYATYCAVNGGCATAGADFWQFSTNGVYPGYFSEVPCGFTLFQDWKLCKASNGITRLGDNQRRMRYYIRSDRMMQEIEDAN